MASVMDYHCPNCGGALEFDAEKQKLRCPYCESLFSPEEFREKDETLTQADPGSAQTESSGTQAGPGSAQTTQTGDHTLSFSSDDHWGEGEDLRVYSCPNCGAEVITDASTAATNCPYCNNVVVMKEQLSGDFRPEYVIPFRVTREQAVEAFRRHITQSRFVPAVFSAQNHPEEIKGVYVPFWLFDVDAEASATFRAENIRRWSDRNYEYVETEIYELIRGGTIAMRHVPVDGSRKMADDLMESIEPFDFRDAVPFQTAYLAGFMADRYDVNYQDCTDRAGQRMEASAMESLKDTAGGYDVITMTGGQCDWKHANVTYALYPVWLLSTQWEGNNYLFAMNGQNGRFVGDLPLDRKKFRIYRIRTILIIMAIIFAIIFISTLAL